MNGGWAAWSSWSACSSSVARGLSQRQRSCTNPAPSALGRSCIGDSTNSRPCPGNLRSTVITLFIVHEPLHKKTINLNTIRRNQRHVADQRLCFCSIDGMMLRLCYVPGVTRRLRKPTSWLASNKLCLKFLFRSDLTSNYM